MAQSHSLNNNYPQSGYIALITITLVGAIIAVIGITIMTLNTAQSKNLIALQTSLNNELVLKSCAELLLLQIRNQPSLNGTGQIHNLDTNCNYQINETSTNEKTIQLHTEHNLIQNQLLIQLQVTNQQLTLLKWQHTQ